VFMTTLSQLDDMARLRLSPLVQLKEGAPTLVDGAVYSSDYRCIALQLDVPSL
jgi:hypothetical protein